MPYDRVQAGDIFVAPPNPVLPGNTGHVGIVVGDRIEGGKVKVISTGDDGEAHISTRSIADLQFRRAKPTIEQATGLLQPGMAK